MPDSKPLTTEDIRAMSPDQINANWDRVKAGLRGEKPLPADLADASDDALGRAASDPERWPEVQREMTRRGEVKAEARALALEEFEQEQRRLRDERQPQFGPVDKSIGR